MAFGKTDNKTPASTPARQPVKVDVLPESDPIPANDVPEPTDEWDFIRSAPVVSGYSMGTRFNVDKLPKPLVEFLDWSLEMLDKEYTDEHGDVIESGASKYKQIPAKDDKQAQRLVNWAKKWALHHPDNQREPKRFSIRAFTLKNRPNVAHIGVTGPRKPRDPKNKNALPGTGPVQK